MPNRIKAHILLIGLLIICSCSDKSKTEDKMQSGSAEVEYSLEKFNELSTFFILDSIQRNDRTLAIYFSDTSKFYQPERHIQNYALTFLTVVGPTEIQTDIDSVAFHINMPFRPDGNINISYSSKDLRPILERYTIPIVKKKIMALNKYNKEVYVSKEGDKNLDVLYKLNMYFAQIVDPGSWVGVDSYGIIWEYEYNKAGGYDLTGHLDAFNKILTDTLYIKDRETGKEVYRILIEK